MKASVNYELSSNDDTGEGFIDVHSVELSYVGVLNDVQDDFVPIDLQTLSPEDRETIEAAIQQDFLDREHYR